MNSYQNNLKMKLKRISCVHLVWLLLFFISCGKSAKQEVTNAEVAKVLKQNSPLDEKKIQKSNAIMMDIYNQMNFIPDMDYFLNIVNHFRKNHLFVNADTDTYIIIGVTNKGFKQIPEADRIKLLDTSMVNSGYQLNFLIHHIITCPKRKYPGRECRSLAGEDIEISDKRFDMRFKEQDYRIISSLNFSDDLEIIAIDSALYH
jgi:hypothetical protein